MYSRILNNYRLLLKILVWPTKYFCPIEFSFPSKLNSNFRESWSFVSISLKVCVVAFPEVSGHQVFWVSEYKLNSSFIHFQFMEKTLAKIEGSPNISKKILPSTQISYAVIFVKTISIEGYSCRKSCLTTYLKIQVTCL